MNGFYLFKTYSDITGTARFQAGQKTERALSHRSFLSIAVHIVKVFISMIVRNRLAAPLPTCYYSHQ